MESTSLLDLAVGVVFENYENYNQQELKNTLATLAKPRRMMFNHFLGTIVDEKNLFDPPVDRSFIPLFWSTLPYLMRCKAFTDFDVADLVTRYDFPSESQFREAIRCLSTNVPNLRQLNLLYRPGSLSPLAFNNGEIDSILKLKHLNILSIGEGCSILLSNFYEILDECELLGMVDVKHMKMDCDVKPLSRKVKKKIWHQKITYTSNLKRTPLSWLVLGKSTCWNPLWNCLLDLDLDCIKDLSNFESLTRDVTHLEFRESKDENLLEAFLHFPRLKYVQYHCSDSSSAKALKSFLFLNGQKLKSLNIYNHASGNLVLNELFYYCPNLYTLDLIRSSLCNRANVPIRQMHQLRDLKWITRCSDDVLPLTTIILSAPLLEDLSFKAESFCLDDSEGIIDLIEAYQVLRHFGSLQFSSMDECCAQNQRLKALITVILRISSG